MRSRLEPDDFSPVFIVGHPRSGTTLLAACLDRNSQIAVTPETHFVNYIAPGLPSHFEGASDHWVREVLTNTRLKDLKVGVRDVAHRLRDRAPTPPNLFRCVLEEYAAARSKALVMEKSPAHIMHLFTLHRWYPRARVVWMIRDGRDAILSLLRMQWASNRLWELSLQWRRNMARAVAFETAHPETVYRIYFEALLREPEAELRRLHEFLGVPFESAQLDADRHTEVVPSWELGWKTKSTGQIDPSQVGAWRQQASADQVQLMNCVMGPVLRRFGYPETSLPPCGAIRRLFCAVVDIALRLVFQRKVYDVLYGTHQTIVSIRESLRRRVRGESVGSE